MVNTSTFDSRAKWLQARKAGIGGSDAATLFDANQWKTESDLIKDKLDPTPPVVSQSGITKMGHIMEPYIFKEHVLPLYPTAIAYDDVIMSNDKYPRLLASPDALTEALVIEIKFVLLMGTGKWKDEKGNWAVPESYQMQVQHYMAVTERTSAIVFAYFEEDGECRQFNIPFDSTFVYQLNMKSIDFFTKVSNYTDELVYEVAHEDKPILVEDLGRIKEINQIVKKLNIEKSAITDRIITTYDDSTKLEFRNLKGKIYQRKTKSGFTRLLKVS